jgi:formylglycine-generating enzyme required for sulfatase activity
LLHKPIALRHPYIFYLGHLPAFLDIQVSKVVGNQTEPLYYSEIFERGIDPVMEDPSQCHAHSKVPDQWPTLDEITAYKNRVHQRIRELLRTNLSKRLQRVLNMCYEHEAMHIETLLYMYVQDSGIEPNRYLPKPIWNPTKVSEAMFVQVPEMTISMGLNDPESGDIDPSSPTSFGWDNEKPEHQVVVPSFEMQHRPVTNQEYFDFLTLNHFDAELVPESWSTLNEKWYIKTVYGLVDLAKGYDWPVFASNFQAQLYAKAKQASLPTEAQLVAARKFVNADDGNHSFQHFTPTPVQEYNGSITDLVGSGWEWSRTLFVPFDGFVQSELYPGYSADFLYLFINVVMKSIWFVLVEVGQLFLVSLQDIRSETGTRQNIHSYLQSFDS